MSRKRKSGPVVLQAMQVPPHLTKCHVCGKERWAYAKVDDKTPPWYLCQGCYEGMIRGK